MKKIYMVFILALLILPKGLKSQELVNFKYGSGLNLLAPDSSMSLKFVVRFQTLFEIEDTESKENITKNMQVRRFRVKFDGFAFHPRLIYKIELALSNRDIAPANVRQFGNAPNIVLDAVLKYSLKDNISLWFGQTKLPGNRERVVSSQNLQFVDRSIVNALYNIDRDLGVQLHHKFKIGRTVINDIYAITIGEGRNVTASDVGGLSYTARLEVLPFGNFTNNGDYFYADLVREPQPKLSLGIGYNYNDRTSRTGGQLGDFLNTSRNLSTLYADAMFKFSGLSIATEFVEKEIRNPVIPEEENYYQSGYGWTIQSGYLLNNNFEFSGRYSLTVPSTEVYLAGFEEEISEYTIGFSKYFKGHNLKIQTDFSLRDVLNQASLDKRFRFQVEMGI